MLRAIKCFSSNKMWQPKNDDSRRRRSIPPLLTQDQGGAEWSHWIATHERPTKRTVTVRSLVTAGHSPLVTTTQGLIRCMVDILAQKMHRTIDEQEVRATRVHRAEPPAPIPFILAGTGGIRDLGRSSPRARVESVDGYDCRGVSIIGPIVAPHAVTAARVIVAGGQHFADEQRL